MRRIPVNVTRTKVGKGGLGQKLIANTFFNFLGQFYTLLLGIAVVPYVVHRLGAEPYGFIAVVAALGGFAGLLNMGMDRALSKYISELYWQGELARIRSLFQTAITVSAIAGATAGLLLIAFRGPLSAALFHGDPSTERFVTFAIFVTGFGVLLSVLTESLSALPLALQRFDIYNRMNILLATLRSLGAVVVVALGLFVRAVLLVYLISSLIGVVGYAYYNHKLIPGLTLRPKFAWPDFRLLFGFCTSVLVAGVGGLVVHRLDRLLVAYFLPVAAVAFYVIPYSLADKAPLIVGNITSVIFPSASELSAREAHGKLRELYVRATKMTLLAGLPVTVILLAVPDQLLHYWVGAEFAARGSLTLQLLVAGFFFNILARVPYTVAQGIGRPWISANYSLLNGVANLVLFLLLIPRYGIVGAGAGFLISQILVMPVFIWEVNRRLGVSWWQLISGAYVRPLACGIGAFALALLLRAWVVSLGGLTLLCAATLGAYALAAFFAGIDSRERIGIYSHVFQILRSPERPADV